MRNRDLLVSRAILFIFFAVTLLAMLLAVLASVAGAACEPGEPCWTSWQATQTVRASEPCISPYVFCPGETRVPPGDPWDPFNVTPAPTSGYPVELPTPGTPYQWEPGPAYIYYWDDKEIDFIWENGVPPFGMWGDFLYRCEFNLTGFAYPVHVQTQYPAFGNPNILMKFIWSTDGPDHVVSNGICTITDVASGEALYFRDMRDMPFRKGDHSSSRVYIPVSLSGVTNDR